MFRFACLIFKAFWVLLVVLWVVPVSASESPDCEGLYEKIVGDVGGANLSERVKLFENLKPDCGGSGIYEARLAKFYEISGRLDDAETLLKKSLKENLPERKVILFTLINTLLAQDDKEEARVVAESLIDGYPAWDGGYLSMGQIQLFSGEYDEGIRNLEKAASIDGTLNAYILLTLGYYQKKQYQESIASLQRAYRRDPEAMLHTDAVCAASLSLLFMGFRDDAKALLEKHLSIKPAAKDDQFFTQAMSVVERNTSRN